MCVCVFVCVMFGLDIWGGKAWSRLIQESDLNHQIGFRGVDEFIQGRAINLPLLGDILSLESLVIILVAA